MPGFRRWMVTLGLTLLAVASSAAPAAARPHVLVVGDSLEELTSPYLGRYLPGVELTVNAVGGSNSYQIFDLFQESYEASDDVIVFDAGTNDNPEYPEILAGNLRKVAAVVGGRCMVVPTIHGFTVNGVDNTGKNRVVAEFAASRPGTQVPDWAAVVATHPELMQSDGLHPIEAGADYRAQLIAQGVEGCLAYDQARASAPPQPEVEVVRIDEVGRMEARQGELMAAIRIDLLRQAAVTFLTGLT
jgi:lysophospholipase L1-like esterase